MKTRSPYGGTLQRFVASVALAAGATWFAAAYAQIPGRNVNMVSGTTLPDGDPFLQRQNEPSGAVSSRNPLHVLAGANDYRTVDLPGLPDELAQGAEDDDQAAVGDAWLGVFKSFDGGSTWRSTLIPGYPQDTSPAGLASPLKGFEAGADPTVRAGTNGLFYYSGIYFNRGDGGLGVVAVSRFVDNNNAFGKTDDPIAFLGTTVVDRGTPTRFIDKPYLLVDIPRPGARTCSITAPGAKTVQRIPAGTVYLAYAVFTGTADHPYSVVYVKRSLDCGVTWGSPAKVSEGAYLNQGVTMAIDPATGRLYVAWRKFADTRFGDAIMFVRTKNRLDDRDDRNSRFDRDRDKSFAEPLEFTDQKVFALTKPFDQGMTDTTFRTTAYPTMTVDASGRLYVAWSERGVGPANGTTPTNPAVPTGDARIVMMTSRDGQLWRTRRIVSHWARPPTAPLPRWKKRPGTTAQQAVENENVPGHQIMPVLTNVGGTITLMYYDLREDVSQVFKQYVNDAEIRDKRHTVDVRVSQADPADDPVFEPSVQVSQYQFGVRRGQHLAEQLQYNVPNLPLYGGGMLPFVGDYIDIAGQTFIQDASGAWRFNVAPGGPTALQAFWTDNRDVRPPLSGDWTTYTPVTSNLSSIACVAGNTGMRNSNIYTSKISQGLVVGSFANAQRLSPTVQRSFVVFAENSTDIMRRYRFTIANQPAGGRASFLQFSKTAGEAPLTTLDATIPPRSIASRTVYVRSTDPLARVAVNVAEVEIPVTPTPQPPLVAGGFTGSILLNPDVINPDVINPDVINASTFNPALSSPDVINPDVINMVTKAAATGNTAVVTPDVINPDVINPDVINPDVINPDVINVVLGNPDVINAALINPDVINPTINNSDLLNPDVINPDVINPDVINGTLVDATWAVRNTGNSVGTFSVKTLLTQAAPLGVVKQLLLYKTYATPVVVNTAADGCVLRQQSQTVLVANIPNPDVINPDVINPDVINPDVINPDVINPDVINAQLALAPGEIGKITMRVFAPQTTPTTTVTLANGRIVKVPFNTTTGQAWNPAQVVVPVVVATTVDTVKAQQVQPGQTPPLPPVALVITTTSLPDGLAGAPYTAAGQPIGINAIGGTGTRTWSIVSGSGALPPGLLLNAATGVISGAPAQAGGYSFRVLVADSGTPQQTADVLLSIRVLFAISPQLLLTSEDTPAQLALSAVGISPTDPLLSFAITTPASHGSVANSLLYSPAANYNGADAFAFNATLQTPNGPIVASGTASITVRPVNDAPVATPLSVSTPASTQLPIVLAGTDLETSAVNLTFAIVAGPTHGVLSGSGANRAYTPADGYSGPDSFTFTATDRGDPDNCGAPAVTCAAPLTSAPATVSIVVTGTPNQPPVFDAGGDQLVAENSGPQTVTNWAIGSPGAHSAACVTGVIATADGFAGGDTPGLAFDCNALTLWNRGGFIGTLEATFPQPATFRGLRLTVDVSQTTAETYTVSVSGDGVTWTPLREVTRTIDQSGSGVFDVLLPRTTTNHLRIHAEESFSFIAIREVQLIVSGEDTQQLSYVLQSDNPGLFSAQPAVDATGTLTFTAAPNAFGIAHVTAHVQDDGGGQNTSPNQSFRITVNGTPHAVADSYTTAPNTPLQITEPSTVSFAGFASTTGIALNGSAATNFPTTTADGTVLRLTNLSIGQSGSAYTSTPQFIARFSTSFKFRITPPDGSGSGGDGFTFAIQRTGTNPNVLSLHDGGDLGYGGVDHSVAVEFDTFSNPQHVDPGGHHIGVDLNGSLRSVKTAATPGFFDDGQLWTAWIDYDGVALEVRVSNTGFRPAAPELTVDINIPAIVGGSSAFIGFTGATGSATESTDVTSWTYAPYTLGLLANDTDPEGDGIRAVLDGGPSHGTLTLGSAGAFLYTPSLNFAGADSFTYHVFDGLSSSASATVSLTVQSPLKITTTSLDEGVLFDSPGTSCLAADSGVGGRTWSVTAGSLPPGVVLQPFGCFFGVPTSLGLFNFTVNVTDSDSPPQSDTKSLSINVSSVVDQVSGSGFGDPPLSFGNGLRIGERVYAGVSGSLRSVRIDSLTCPLNTLVTTQIQGVTGAGQPDGNTLAAGTSTVTTTSPFGITLRIPLPAAPFFGADAPYAVVFDANAVCAVVPSLGDANPGEGFVFSAGWQRLADVDGRDDIPFESLVQPVAGFSFMTVARGAHSATQLQDGRVLLAGSDDTAELYDPAAGTSTATGFMNMSRANHTATLLSDGTVLLTGGTSSSLGTFLDSAELFHPNTGTFESLPATMSTARSQQTATLLLDGRVLIAGGFFNDSFGVYHAVQTADIYTPSLRSFTSVGTMLGARDRHTATLLADGRVLLAGGFGSGPSAEIFDPVTSSFTATAGSSATRFAWHTAVRLADGRVLLAGGADAGGNATSHAELFTSSSGGTFASAGTLMHPRLQGTAALLPDGSALFAGGSFDVSCCSSRPHAPMERYVVGVGFVNAGSMAAARYVHAAAPLSCPAGIECSYGGQVVLAGTFGTSVIAARTAELYDPASAISLANGLLPDGHFGVPYAGSGMLLAGQGGLAPYTIQQVSGTFPAGLAFNPSTRMITGTPGELGTFDLGFTVTDSTGHSNTQVQTLRVLP